MCYLYIINVCIYLYIGGRIVMNVYDFDGTIYNGDSTIDFYIYALKSKPSIIK